MNCFFICLKFKDMSIVKDERDVSLCHLVVQFETKDSQNSITRFYKGCIQFENYKLQAFVRTHKKTQG